MTDFSQELPPRTILGDYTIERTIGKGSFSVTYQARDNTLGVRVIIKENLPEPFAHRDPATLQVRPHGHPDDKASFEWSMSSFINEACTLASLNHPNIVKVTRAFTALGTAYFVMPYVEGESLETYAEKHPRPSEAWLRSLLKALLSALGYLHSRQLLHRDIKPANILLTENGQPQIIDFGAARQLISERTQSVCVSEGYTPIEQLMSRGKVGAWTDIYSLGCLLCKLITGETPPPSRDRAGKDDPFVPLSRRKALRNTYSPRFLSGIDKAMKFAPTERWQNTEDWALSLERRRQAAPAPPEKPQEAPAARTAEAQPCKKKGRFCKWLSQVLLMASISIGGTALYLEYGDSRQGSDEDGSSTPAPGNELQLQSAAPAGNPVPAQEQAAPPPPPILGNGAQKLRALACSPDGRLIATGGEDRSIRLWDLQSGTQLGDALQTGGTVKSVAFSPDGKLLASASMDGSVRLWNVAGRRQAGRTLPHEGDVRAVCFSPDGTRLATASWDNSACIRNTDRLRQSVMLERGGRCWSVAFSPDGRHLATGFRGKLLIWDTESHKQVGPALPHDKAVTSVAYSPDGTRLVTADASGRVRLWNATTHEPMGEAMQHRAWVNAVAFSPDGRSIASASWDDTVMLWDAQSGRPIAPALQHQGNACAVVFSPDGRLLISAGQDGIRFQNVPQR